jgi:transcriptional regulator with XRE-family HTH domain
MIESAATLTGMEYADRLKQALADAGVSIADFARSMGLTYQAVSKVLKGTTKSLTAANNDKAAKLLHVDPGWLATGDGSAATFSDQKDPVAHLVSDLRPIVNLQKVTWEALPVSDLSGRFEIDLRDDALAPEYPAGTAIRFDAKRPPRPGWPVLVKDSAGAFYVRDYIEGAAGQWTATPRQRGYASLDSVAHGLQLVGVMYGADWP